MNRRSLLGSLLAFVAMPLAWFTRTPEPKVECVQFRDKTIFVYNKTAADLFPNWRDYTFSYTSVTREEIVEKMKRAMDKQMKKMGMGPEIRRAHQEKR